MIQLPGVEWGLLETENGASTDWIVIVVVVVVVCGGLVGVVWTFQNVLRTSHLSRTPKNTGHKKPVQLLGRDGNN